MIQQNPAQILEGIMNARRGKNHAYSVSAFARDIGVSQSLLSLVLRGKRRLTVNQARKISILLNLDKSREQELLDAAQMNSARAGRVKTKIENAWTERESRKASAVEIEKFTAVAKWYHFPILTLITTKTFKNNHTWIAKRLGISAFEAKEALERLKSLGLIAEVDGKLRLTKQNVEVLPKKSELAVREHHNQMMNQAREVMASQTAEKQWLAREISGLSMGVDPSKMPQAKELVRKFKEDIAALMTEGEATEVYQLNVQLFPLTRSDS